MGTAPSARLITEQPTESVSRPAAGGILAAPPEPNAEKPSLILHASAADQELDSSLIVLIIAGNELAMATLYDRHCAFVYSIARRFLEPSLADMCIHEVFIALWRAPELFSRSRRGLEGALALQTVEKAMALRSAGA